MKKLKVGTLFSGGLGGIEFALKYEDIQHEVTFACEIDHHARKQYLSFHGSPTDQFYISVDDNPLNLYKPLVFTINHLVKHINFKGVRDRKWQFLRLEMI